MSSDADISSREGGPRSTRSLVQKLQKSITKKNDEIKKWKIQFQQEKVLREYERTRNNELQDELSQRDARISDLEEDLDKSRDTIRRLVESDYSTEWSI
jgi:chromosome segregation ATPase